ncbi:MAG: hypothetical protein KAI74_01670 [Kiritimatiellae bacterium]|nr:hypothetical protein [Kiritimatiellia bacterium]
MNAENKSKVDDKVAVPQLVALLGKIISGVDLYGIEHSISIEAMESSFELLGNILINRKRISFNIVDNQLLIDMVPLTESSNFIARFIERLAILEIAGFTFTRGMSEDEFIQFIILLTARETANGGGDFAKALDESGLEHIAASKVMLREVLEDEDVFKKDEKDGDGDADGDGGYGSETVQQIVAFLKGDVDVDAPDALQDIDPTENNIGKLSELIMNSVSISQRNPDLATGESIGDILVGCLRRTFSTQLKSSSSKTKAGRKKIAKSLLMMEKSVLDKLHDFAAGASDEDLPEQVTTCMGNMRDELKVDGVVSDYAKRQKSVNTSEMELLKLLKNKDAAWIKESGLHDKLNDGGMDESEWNKMVVQSGITSDSSHDVLGDSTSTLERVLTDLSKLLDDFDGEETGVDEKQRVVESLEQVSKEVDAVVEHTNDKINDLAIGLKDSADKDSSTKHEWALVQEIVQELCQPLSVISCAVDMLVGDYFGTLPPDSKPALELASESSERMKNLADRLVEVCGVPSSLLPEPVLE